MDRTSASHYNLRSKGKTPDVRQQSEPKGRKKQDANSGNGPEDDPVIPLPVIKRYDLRNANSNRNLQSVPWARLPREVMIKIYEKLGDVDRVRMSTMCKSWRNAFYSSALWRARTLSPSMKNVKWAKMFGRHLRQLTLDCSPPWSTNTFAMLLSTLDKARIQAFDVSKLYEGLQSRTHRRMEVIAYLMKFLESQIHLEEIAIMYPEMWPLEACALLRSLPSSIYTIDFRITSDRQHVWTPHEAFWSKMEKFTRLVWLDLDYFWFNTELNQRLCRIEAARTLHYLTLGIYNNERGIRPIPASVWRQLRKVNPWIKVGLLFHSVEVATIRSLLVSEVPLFHLTLRWMEEFHNVPERSCVREILNLVSDVHPSLMQLRLIVEFRNMFDSETEEALLRMLQKCRYLGDLVLTADMSLGFLEQLLKLQAANTIQLRYIHVKALLFDVESEPYFALMKIFKSKLNVCELDFCVGETHRN